MALLTRALLRLLPALLTLAAGTGVARSAPAPARPQPPGPTVAAPDLFAAGRYAEYLKQMQQELAPAPPGQEAALLGRLLSVAIALEKTHAGQEEAGRAALALLGDREADLNTLAALQRLLGGDPTGLGLYFRAQPAGRRTPAARRLLAQVPVLQRHGYPGAAEAVGVLRVLGDFGEVEQGVRALAAIPLPRRAPIEAALDEVLAEDPARRQQIATVALQLWIRSLQGAAATPAPVLLEYQKVAVRFCGGADIRFLSVVQQALGLGKKREGAFFLKTLAAQHPNDAAFQRRAASLYRMTGDKEGAVALYQSALRTVPEPEARDVRLEYADYLKHTGGVEALDPLKGEKTTPLAADALLLAGEREEAAALYRERVADAQAPVEARLAAWSGLLDVDPEAALRDGGALLEQAAQSKGAAARPLILWFAGRLWAAAARSLPVEGEYRLPVGPAPFLRLTDAEGWERQIAALMERLLALDAPGCLRPAAPPERNGWRYGAAVVLALADEPAQAAALLRRRTEYEPAVPLPPRPPGPSGKAPARVLLSSPAAGEPERLMAAVVTTVARCPRAEERVPALAAALAADLADGLKAAQDESAAILRMRALADVVKQAAAALEPRPDGGAPAAAPVEARLAPVDEAVRRALKPELGALLAPTLVQEGLLPAMLSARSQGILGSLFALSLAALDRYAEAAKRPRKLAQVAAYVAGQLDARADYDLKPYARRLRERYPAPDPAADAGQ